MQISYKPASANGGALTDALRPKVFDADFHEITDVRCESVTHVTGVEPNRAELVAVLDSFRRTKNQSDEVTVGEFRMEHALDRDTLSLGLDDEVIVGVPLGGQRVLVLFRGRISDVEVGFDEGDETVTLTALGPRRMLDARDVRGCEHIDPTTSGATVFTDEAVVFNREGVGNFDEENSYSDDVNRPLFADAAAVESDDNPSWTGFWRLRDLWNYLLAHYCPEDEARPPRGEDAFPLPDEKNPVLPPTDVDGLLPSRALDHVLGTYGLDWWIDPVAVVKLKSEPDLSTLPVFRVLSPQDGPVKSLMLAEAGTTFDKSTTNVQAGTLTVSTRPTINHWIIEGGFREYEAAFELTKLWTDDEEDSVDADPDKGNRAHADYEVSLDHVWRQWGLNEDEHWADRTAYDFDALLGAGKWVRRRRRFLPPYTEPGAGARKIVVEVKTADLTTWHRVASGSVRLLSDRAGIYFDLADVDGSASRLRLEDAEFVMLDDLTHVRLTAIIRSDERVTYEAGKREVSGSTLTFTRTLRRSDFRKVTRDASSAYSADGTGLIRNDATDDGPMEELATECRSRKESLDTEISVTVPWTEFAYRVGDRISILAGRELAFVTKRGDDIALPWVRRIKFAFTTQATRIDLW